MTDDEKERMLERAARARVEDLRRLTAIYQACTCGWPIYKLRSNHGHAPECPAVAVVAEFWDPVVR